MRGDGSRAIPLAHILVCELLRESLCVLNNFQLLSSALFSCQTVPLRHLMHLHGVNSHLDPPASQSNIRKANLFFSPSFPPSTRLLPPLSCQAARLPKQAWASPCDLPSTAGHSVLQAQRPSWPPLRPLSSYRHLSAKILTCVQLVSFPLTLCLSLISRVTFLISR